MSHKVKIIIVDKNKNTVITEMDKWLYERLNIKNADIKTHKSQSSINKEVTNFIKTFGNS